MRSGRHIGEDTWPGGYNLRCRGGGSRLALCHRADPGQIAVQRSEIAVGHRLVSEPYAVEVFVHLQAAVFQGGAQPLDDLLPITVRGSHLLTIVHHASAGRVLATYQATWPRPASGGALTIMFVKNLSLTNMFVRVSVMTPQARIPVSRRERPAKSALTREGIVAAAVGVMQAEGLDRVTMRRLAQELDTGAASLYVYVRNTAA